MIDRAYLRYCMEKHGVSREDLIKAEDWSATTYTRKVVTRESEWTVDEIKVLIRLGIAWDEVEQIFFAQELALTTNEN